MGRLSLICEALKRDLVKIEHITSQDSRDPQNGEQWCVDDHFELESLSEAWSAMDWSQRLLHFCVQDEPIKFSDIFGHSDIIISKISEGNFGEFYATENGHVLNIIPIKCQNNMSASSNQSVKLDIDEGVRTGLFTSFILSKVTERGINPLDKIFLVRGKLDIDEPWSRGPNGLIKAWEEFREEEGDTGRKHPKDYPEDQIYFVLRYETPGGEMLDPNELTGREIISLAFQLLFTLATLEERVEFCHNDLRLDCILFTRTSHETINFSLAGKNYALSTIDVQASILDSSFSRFVVRDPIGANEVKSEPLIIYQDLERYPQLFDYELQQEGVFQVYRKIRELNSRNWSRNVPRSNILFLNLIINSLLSKSEIQCGEDCDEQRARDLAVELKEKLIDHGCRELECRGALCFIKSKAFEILWFRASGKL